MAAFRIRRPSAGATLLSNNFIDHYMPGANGEYVKIYLYFLRLAADPSLELTLSEILDTLESTSKDVNRALAYWEKLGLLTCDFDASHTLTGIAFPPASASSPQEASAAAALASGHQTLEISQRPEKALAEKPASSLPSAGNGCEEPSDTSPERTALPGGRLSALKEDAGAREILFIAEQYLRHTLSEREAEMILYFYDQRHFSVELLDYLLDACISNGHTGWRYIQKVGLSWDKDGIDTVEKAKKRNKMYNKRTYAIMKAYGLNGRNPAEAEAKLIHRWVNEYPVSFDLVLEAINRTMEQIHTPSFSYTDSILKNWVKADVRSFPDLEKADAAHQKKKEARRPDKGTGAQRALPRQKAGAATAFHDFDTRTYDHAELTKKLVRL